MGYSTCSDEINRDVTGFDQHYGKNQFLLGGLTGYPFTGKTGFSAYAHHGATNGHLLVLYGPHVGVSLNGELGKVLRDGQPEPSSACGAALAFLSKYEAARAEGKPYRPVNDPLDQQQFWLETLLLPHGERIVRSANPVRELVEVNYEIIDRVITQIAREHKSRFPGNIFLVGGIMINSDVGNPNYFQPRRFERLYNSSSEDLMQNAPGR